MATQISYESASCQQNAASSHHDPVPDAGFSPCECGTCATYYFLPGLSPSTSVCSSLRSDISPCTPWTTNMNTPATEVFQAAYDATYLEVPHSLGTSASPELVACLQQVNLDRHTLRIATEMVEETDGTSNNFSSTPESSFPTVQPVSTIASRNEVRFRMLHVTKLSRHADNTFHRDERRKTVRLSGLFESANSKRWKGQL